MAYFHVEMEFSAYTAYLSREDKLYRICVKNRFVLNHLLRNRLFDLSKGVFVFSDKTLTCRSRLLD
jgi:hypothetical protein